MNSQRLFEFRFLRETSDVTEEYGDVLFRGRQDIGIGIRQTFDHFRREERGELRLLLLQQADVPNGANELGD